jgi:carotenoid cleavage dioxygenase
MSAESKTDEKGTSIEAEELDRRRFLGGALGTLAGAAALTGSGSAAAQAGPPPGPPNPQMGGPPRGPGLFRMEMDVADCEVEGKLPPNLNGAFYRVGPDPMYPLHAGNIPFDGEGHVSMFRFENGHVSYRSRYARNQRYKAQAAAHRILFPMYRNPMTDDPSVKGLSRGTANTHIMFHNKLLLSLKEDSPPVAMNPLTLETVDDYYTFNGQLESKTFTAHPKIDSETGNMVAFGYEAKGFGTDDVNVFEYTPNGKKVWDAWIKVPYIGMLHDFAVTQKHVIFYVIPLAFDIDQMNRGGIHWSWDGTKPTYFGVLRRGGDGKDLRWFNGPERSATHVMGTFDDGNKLYIDVEMSGYNPFPFMPFRDGTKWGPERGSSRITRLSADLSKKSVKDYGMEVLYPNHLGALPRQDDRYNTVPYRIGFLPCQYVDPQTPGKSSTCYARFDHQTRNVQLYKADEGTTLAECCFAPRNSKAGEGVGYLMGVASRMREGGRADLLIFDAEHVDQGPIATVKMPTRIVGQIHGWWTAGEQLGTAV